MPKNWKTGPFGVFQHPFCRKTSKNWRGNFFSDKKSHSAEKTERWDPLRFFNIHSDAKQQKNWKEDPLRKKKFSKKSLAVPKKIETVTLWSRPVWYVTRKNRKNLSGSVPGFPPIQKQVNHTLPSYSQYDSRLIILWTIKVYGSSLTIFWAIYGSVYDQPGTINLYGPEYGQPGAIKSKLG